MPSLDAKLVSDFWARVKSIAKTAPYGQAFFIDGFELIANHEGFSSLLKACPPGIKFVITGNATTERELVRDHKSIDRQMSAGKLPVEKMQDSELLTVIDTAERSIANEIVHSRDAEADVRRACASRTSRAQEGPLRPQLPAILMAFIIPATPSMFMTR